MTTTVLEGFIKDAPPGELTDVVNDVKIILGNDSTELESVESAFREYNENQHMPVKLEGEQQCSIVSKYTRVEEGRYADHALGKTFQYVHRTREASDAQPYERVLSDLIPQIESYVQDHMCDDHAFQVAPYEGKEMILIVGSRYNPNNFWNGRWRSVYGFDGTSIIGTIHIDIHYYEDGNVRFTCTKPVDLNVRRDKIGQTIAELENQFHEEVNKEFEGLNEGAFKALRRQLPVSRQRMNWAKIEQYRIGMAFVDSK